MDVDIKKVTIITTTGRTYETELNPKQLQRITRLLIPIGKDRYININGLEFLAIGNSVEPLITKNDKNENISIQMEAQENPPFICPKCEAKYHRKDFFEKHVEKCEGTSDAEN